MPMTKLEKQDRRRAMSVIDAMNAEQNLTVVIVRDLIAAALKREREETGFAAMQYFFAKKAKRKAAPEPKA